MHRHTLDPVSFVAGIFFLGLGVVVFAGGLDLGPVAMRYVGPLLVIVLGAAIALSAPLSRATAPEADQPRDADDEQPSDDDEPGGW